MTVGKLFQYIIGVILPFTHHGNHLIAGGVVLCEDGRQMTFQFPCIVMNGKKYLQK